MRRRIAIIIFPVLLLLSLLGWGISYPYPFTFAWPFGSYEGLMVVDGGTVALVWQYDPVHPNGYCPDVFMMNDEDAYLGRDCSIDSDSPHLWGFSLVQIHDTRPPWNDHIYWVRIPLWFPTVVSALLMIYMWRRWRRIRPERAFPVEVRGEKKP